MRPSGMIALVTGSSTGTGAAIAKGMAAEGANLVVNDVMGAGQTADAIAAIGREMLVVQTDVGDQ